jgi:hypothetical protein
VKRVVRHWEDASALSECQFALDHAVQVFKVPAFVFVFGVLFTRL